MPIKARRLIKKMRGGAQAHLVEAENGGFYVVKFQNNPQHRRVLVNELVASIFLRYLQLATPETAPIELTESFLRDNPETGMELANRREPPAVGVHFGSRFPGDPGKLAVYDFLPDLLLDQVRNLRHFLGTLVFDKWVGNGDSRQSIFFRARLRDWGDGEESAAQPKLGFVALMIDNGFVFNGPHWDFPDLPVQGLYIRKTVYQSVRSLDDFQPWLDQVKHFPEEVVDQAYRQVPAAWIEGEEDAFERLLERLLKRRRRVADLIEECRRSKAGPFPQWR
jgi:hypothetical protein